MTISANSICNKPLRQSCLHKQAYFGMKPIENYINYFNWVITVGAKGRMAAPNRMNFRKNSKRPSTPPPHFCKIMLQIFYNGHGQIFARRYEGHSEGWGSTENSSDLVAWPVPKKSFTKRLFINLFGFHAIRGITLYLI